MTWIVPAHLQSLSAEYRIVLKEPESGQSGFQVYKATGQDSKRCKPGGSPGHPKGTSAAQLGVNDGVYLVRCSIGTGKGTILVQRRATPQDAFVNVRLPIPISQSWHRAGHQVAYRIADPFIESSGQPLPDHDLIAKAVKHSVDAWNAAQSAVKFEEAPVSHNLLILGYWNTSDSNDPCPGSIACFYPGVFGDPVTWNIYPELTTSEVWFEFPPQFPADPAAKQWTNDWIMAKKHPQDHYYFPRTMMHELGHAAGLGHTEVKSVMSYARPGDPEKKPVPYEANHFASYYANHERH